MEPKSLDGDEDDDDSNLYAEIQADAEEEQRQDSRMGKDYDCLDFYRNGKLTICLYFQTTFNGIFIGKKLVRSSYIHES